MKLVQSQWPTSTKWLLHGSTRQRFSTTKTAKSIWMTGKCQRFSRVIQSKSTHFYRFPFYSSHRFWSKFEQNSTEFYIEFEHWLIEHPKITHPRQIQWHTIAENKNISTFFGRQNVEAGMAWRCIEIHIMSNRCWWKKTSALYMVRWRKSDVGVWRVWFPWYNQAENNRFLTDCMASSLIRWKCKWMCEWDVAKYRYCTMALMQTVKTTMMCARQYCDFDQFLSIDFQCMQMWCVLRFIYSPIANVQHWKLPNFPLFAQIHRKILCANRFISASNLTNAIDNN